MPLRYTADEVDVLAREWEPLPYRFHRLDGERVVLTNIVGEFLLVTAEEFAALTGGELDAWPELRRALAARHFIRLPSDALPVELLAMKLRTRYRRLSYLTALHIFVVTLRCEHTCQYCQVSRQNSANTRFDMTSDTADRALDAVFQSPSPAIKIEFQGGEPLLNFGLVREIVLEAELRNRREQRDLTFVIATNLALLDDSILEFAAQHRVHFSTSLDGPAELHNGNRPRPGRNSWELAVAGIERIRTCLGPDRVAALMTTTETSLDSVASIIDTYVDCGLDRIFLRPLSPYGFAARRARATDDARRWLDFYARGLDYVLELNRNGTPFVEQYAAIILKKMLTNDDPGYVDLTSPAGIGIGAIVYNYDADVYASDEGRMLAEMGDHTFRLGNLHNDSYQDLITAESLLEALDQSFAFSAPMCNDCAFEPFCGADPVYHHTTAGDFLGRKPTSGFCNRNMGVFTLLIDRYHSDPHARDVFERWAHQ